MEPALFIDGEPLPIVAVPIEIDLEGRFEIVEHTIYFGIGYEARSAKILLPRFSDERHPQAMKYKTAVYEPIDLLAQEKFGGEWMIASVESVGWFPLEDSAKHLYGIMLIPTK